MTNLFEEPSTSFCDRWFLLGLTHVHLAPFPWQVNQDCVVFVVAYGVEAENEEENNLKICREKGLDFTLSWSQSIGINQVTNTRQRKWPNFIFCVRHNLKTKRNHSKDLARCKPGKSLLKMETCLWSKTPARIYFRKKCLGLWKVLYFL